MRYQQGSGLERDTLFVLKGKYSILLASLVLLTLSLTACQGKPGEKSPTSGNLTYKAAGKDINLTAWNSEVATDIILI
jgi:hypothetical protein